MVLLPFPSLIIVIFSRKLAVVILRNPPLKPVEETLRLFETAICAPWMKVTFPPSRAFIAYFTAQNVKFVNQCKCNVVLWQQ